jgi:hypothetical protein
MPGRGSMADEKVTFASPMRSFAVSSLLIGYSRGGLSSRCVAWGRNDFRTDSVRAPAPTFARDGRVRAETCRAGQTDADGSGAEFASGPLAFTATVRLQAIPPCLRWRRLMGVPSERCFSLTPFPSDIPAPELRRRS